MRKQTFDKIKKTLAILLAVFIVVSFTAASASACSTKNVKNKLASDKGDNKLTEKQKTELGNRLLDFADKNMFGNLRGGNGCEQRLVRRRLEQRLVRRRLEQRLVRRRL